MMFVKNVAVGGEALRSKCCDSAKIAAHKGGRKRRLCVVMIFYCGAVVTNLMQR